MIMTSHHKTGTSVLDLLAPLLATSFPNKVVRVDESDAARHNYYWPNSTAVWRALESKNSADTIAVLTNPHAGTWPPPSYPEVRCLVHITRNLVDLVVSAYLYHLRMGRSQAQCGDHLCEPWLYEPTDACLSLPGVSHFDKLHLAPNETAGLLCQLEHSWGNIEEVRRMEREVLLRPNLGMTMLLDEWRDSSTAIHKVFSFCGMEDMAETAILEYNNGFAELSKSSHVNHEGERAFRLRTFLSQTGLLQ